MLPVLADDMRPKPDVIAIAIARGRHPARDCVVWPMLAIVLASFCQKILHYLKLARRGHICRFLCNRSPYCEGSPSFLIQETAVTSNPRRTGILAGQTGKTVHFTRGTGSAGYMYGVDLSNPRVTRAEP
jgi:hypothetical protein